MRHARPVSRRPSRTRPTTRRSAVVLLTLLGVVGLLGAIVGPVEAAPEVDDGPSLTVDDPGPLASRGQVPVSGTGYGPYEWLLLYQCVGAGTDQCRELAAGDAEVGAEGTFSTEVFLSRQLGDVDCAARPGRCQLVVASSGADDPATLGPPRASVGLTFDDADPAVVPAVTLDPTDGLRHLQTVTVAGKRLLPATQVHVFLCPEGGSVWTCLPISGDDAGGAEAITTDGDGAFRVAVEVPRRLGARDCAIDPCTVGVHAPPEATVFVPVTFDATTAPPPAATMSVDPAVDLVDGQTVTVAVSDVVTGAGLDVEVCERDGTRCRWAGWIGDDGTTASTPIVVRRMLGDVDCAVAACEVRARSSDGLYDLRAPLSFDPQAPLASGPEMVVEPASGLVDRQQVEVRVERFDPASFSYVVHQCVGAELTESACSGGTTLYNLDSPDTFSERFTVRRVLRLPGGDRDCAVENCHLVVGERSYDPETGTGGWTTLASVALGFDPDAALVMSGLPPQPACVPWPTGGWAEGPLPEGVDAAALDVLAEELVSTSDDASSMVVIHGGRLVHESYADGVTRESILPSFSVSKSITSTVVGLLVDQGKLALDERAPIAEWADPGDPRHAITLRHLLTMSSGLEWEENYYRREADAVQMAIVHDAAALAINKPLDPGLSPPGTSTSYRSGDTLVLGKIIGQTAGVSGPSYEGFLRDVLFDPLGIGPVDPHFDGAGNWGSAWKTDMATRDFAKLGLLYLRDGVWDGEQFLSSDWVELVRTPAPTDPGYGAQFRLGPDGSFTMVGFLGQYVHIVPRLDLVVAMNNTPGHPYSQVVDLFESAEPTSCDGPPVATDDAATVVAGGAVEVDVLANDSAGATALDPASLRVVAGPSHGEATADPERGTVTYRSTGEAAVVDELEYRVCGVGAAAEGCATAVLTITVTDPAPGAVGSGPTEGPGDRGGPGEPGGAADPGGAGGPGEPGGAAGPGGRVAGWLARTGSGVAGLLAAGAALVVVGGVVVRTTRRRAAA